MPGLLYKTSFSQSAVLFCAAYFSCTSFTAFPEHTDYHVPLLSITSKSLETREENVSLSVCQEFFFSSLTRAFKTAKSYHKQEMSLAVITSAILTKRIKIDSNLKKMWVLLSTATFMLPLRTTKCHFSSVHINERPA